jgi:hypothetical protein
MMPTIHAFVVMGFRPLKRRIQGEQKTQRPINRMTTFCQRTRHANYPMDSRCLRIRTGIDFAAGIGFCGHGAKGAAKDCTHDNTTKLLKTPLSRGV